MPCSTPIASTRANISARRLRGTATSSMRTRPRASIAGWNERRIVSRRSRSAADPAGWTLPPAVWRRGAASSAAAAAPGPSNSTRRNTEPAEVLPTVSAITSGPRYAAIPSRAAASRSSTVEGRSAPVTTSAAAHAASSTFRKTAPRVAGSPAGTGTSRTVAPTMTPRVPSEPTSSAVRSSPVTPFTVRCPVETRRPSASTTSRPSTASRVTPYFTHRSPPAFVAMLPPTVEIAALAGSGANRSPNGATSAFSAPFNTPVRRSRTRPGSTPR